MDSVLELLYPKLILFLLGFWSFVSTCLLHLLRYFIRFTRKSGSSKGISNDSRISLAESMEEEQEFLEILRKEDDRVDEKEDENEALEFSFSFKFPTFDEFSKNPKRFSQFLDYTEHVNTSEVSLEDSEGDTNSNCGLVSNEGHVLEFEESVHDTHDDQECVVEQVMVVSSNLKKIMEAEEKEDIYTCSEEKLQKDNVEYVNISFHPNVDSNASLNLRLPTNDVHHSEDGFLSDETEIAKMEEAEEFGTFGEENLQKVDDESVHSSPDLDMKEEDEEFGTFGEENLQKVDDESVHFSPDLNKKEEDEEFDTFGEENLQKLDDESVHSSPHSPTFDLHPEDGFLSDSDFEEEFDKKDVKDENEHNTWTQSDFLTKKDFGEKSVNEKNQSSDTTNKLESLWEHQELIEQLKMEIKKVKAIGLPTIFEESESPPKIMEDLKPWKIEEVYQNGAGKMGEVHKFYKSYRERMRKLDIFSYQKMYTIGFLQLKDPPQSSSISKSPITEFTTLFGQSFITNKGRKHENDPTTKFIKELQSDLEVVYVGQMCLSWEILHWQYEKALDIWESDTRCVRRFNDIAGEFQQFQVLMQRFIEDEPFQGPRIQSYVKNRCVFRNLLQVPVIRDDHMKNRKARNEVVYDITSDALVEILEESIRIFWRFVRADKYKRQTPVEFQRPEDSQLFLDLQKDLHKKEKKLKEQLRSGNSILKKLRSCKEDETEDQVLYFFCQVDMKLVSRVLQMSRLTSDQLIWCHNKLSKVSFVNTKIHVEPSFLLFPC